LDGGEWCSVYRDPVRDDVERQIDVSNQNLSAAEAAFRQAEAIVAQARASFFPTATVNAEAQRSRSSGSFGKRPGGPGSIANLFSISAAASWIPDLWGCVR